MPYPALFIGHGSPMNAIEDNQWSRAWRALGEGLPRPRGVVCVSAHWVTDGTAVTAMQQPRTIHDFGGFPQALFDVQYPAPGDPALAAEVAELLGADQVMLDQSWGLDHGAWSVLVHLFPQADVPVVQLSLDGRLDGPAHLDQGRKLAPLRDRGTLLLGTGNIVHNLKGFFRGGATAPPADWATRFDAHIAALLEAGEMDQIANFTDLPDADQAAPDWEHFWPLLYVLGTWGPGEALTCPTTGFQGAGISMRSVQVG
ncbi:MAG TPA: 4,5-DOPA dioxygenase extradiol [bacterium]|nr:4,5-DOPA dioxygenase extradiol [bacterium]